MFSNSHHQRERRSRHRAAFGAGLASLALALGVLGSLASTSGAVLVPKDGSGGGSTGSAPPCPTVPPATWTTSPRVLIHTTGLPTAQRADDQVDRLVAQAEDAVGQLNDIGASSLHVGSVATTKNPFEYESTTFGDAVPTIHVGFVTHAKITADNGGDDAGGLTSKMYMAGCKPTVTIEFPVDGKRSGRSVRRSRTSRRSTASTTTTPASSHPRRATTRARGSGRRSCTRWSTRSASPTRARPTR